MLEPYLAQLVSSLSTAFEGQTVESVGTSPKSNSFAAPNLRAMAARASVRLVLSGVSSQGQELTRLFRQLTHALEVLKENQEASANAVTQVRLAVLAAWAELLLDSESQHYLISVVEP